MPRGSEDADTMAEDAASIIAPLQNNPSSPLNIIRLM